MDREELVRRLEVYATAYRRATIEWGKFSSVTPGGIGPTVLSLELIAYRLLTDKPMSEVLDNLPVCFAGLHTGFVHDWSVHTGFLQQGLITEEEYEAGSSAVIYLFKNYVKFVPKGLKEHLDKEK